MRLSLYHLKKNPIEKKGGEVSSTHAKTITPGAFRFLNYVLKDKFTIYYSVCGLLIIAGLHAEEECHARIIMWMCCACLYFFFPQIS